LLLNISHKLLLQYLLDVKFFMRFLKKSRNLWFHPCLPVGRDDETITQILNSLKIKRNLFNHFLKSLPAVGRGVIKRAESSFPMLSFEKALTNEGRLRLNFTKCVREPCLPEAGRSRVCVGNSFFKNLRAYSAPRSWKTDKDTIRRRCLWQHP